MSFSEPSASQNATTPPGQRSIEADGTSLGYLHLVTDQGSGGESVRAAEIIAATCPATDLGMGFPFEHGLHGTLMAMRLADLLDVDAEMASHAYYACLLAYSGCTTDVDVSYRIFSGSRTENFTLAQHGSPVQAVAGLIRSLPPPDAPLPRRIFETTRRLVPAARFIKPHVTAICEVAETMARRLGTPPGVSDLFVYLTEHWDGNGLLKRAKGDEIPMPLRIAAVAARPPTSGSSAATTTPSTRSFLAALGVDREGDVFSRTRRQALQTGSAAGRQGPPAERSASPTA